LSGLAAKKLPKDTMRILLFGKNGQLGWELCRTLAPLGEVIAYDFPEVDLSEGDSLTRIVRRLRPEVIVNAAAYTAVDRAESEVERAFAVNARAPGLMAEEAQALGAALVHYSTDYVFDGGKGSPYVETDTPNPLGVYGRSKLEGERAVEQACQACLTLRTSWVYSLRGDSFVAKVLQWSRQQPTLRVVDDQIGCPTWAHTLADATARLLAMGGKDISGWLRERGGLYHLAGDGFASRFEWAQAILRYDPHREGQVTRQVLPARTADFPTPAQRPLFSALDCTKFGDAFGFRLPAWEEALRLAMRAG
jgi:dTDP-4-dehydrorhamnose reductase